MNKGFFKFTLLFIETVIYYVKHPGVLKIDESDLCCSFSFKYVVLKGAKTKTLKY